MVRYWTLVLIFSITERTYKCIAHTVVFILQRRIPEQEDKLFSYGVSVAS